MGDESWLTCMLTSHIMVQALHHLSCSKEVNWVSGKRDQDKSHVLNPWNGTKRSIPLADYWVGSKMSAKDLLLEMNFCWPAGWDHMWWHQDWIGQADWEEISKLSTEVHVIERQTPSNGWLGWQVPGLNPMWGSWVDCTSGEIPLWTSSKSSAKPVFRAIEYGAAIYPQLPIRRRGGVFCQPRTCQAPYSCCDNHGNVLYSQMFLGFPRTSPPQSFTCNTPPKWVSMHWIRFQFLLVYDGKGLFVAFILLLLISTLYFLH